MLRYAARSTVQRNGRVLLTGIRQESSSGPAKSGGGAGKKLALTLITGSAVAGGTLGYAYANPDFRDQLESTVPQAKVVTDAVLGPAPKKHELPTLTALLPKKLPQVEAPPDPPLEPVAAPKKVVHVDPVDVHKPSVADSAAIQTEKKQRANKDLENRLLAAIASAEKRVKTASDAKIRTIQAVNDHAVTLKKAVDDGVNANWESVSNSLVNAEKLATVDISEENDSRNFIDNLIKVVEDGKKSEFTKGNPLLVNAKETANKLKHQLDELNSLVQKARNESRVLNQYKDLVDKSRQQFSLELKAILPDVDVNNKNTKLTEDELNALIAHAHLRVDQLRRQLTEQQVREEQNIAKAIEDQRAADANLAKLQLKTEVQRIQDLQEVAVEREVGSQRALWEKELEDRLKRAAQAHSEHIEQVVRTQKQLHDIENAQAVEEAVSKERRLHSKQVDIALSKLSGIETALQSRVALDAENRRAKQYWLACQNLVQSIIYGQKAGETIDARRKPLQDELNVLQKACEKDEFVQSILPFFTSNVLSKGTYTESDLKKRFKTVFKLAKRTAKVDENGGGIVAYLSSYIQSFFMLELSRQYSIADVIDANNIDTYEIIGRAKVLVDEGDLENAVRLLQLLRGEPRRIANDWISDTQEHLATRFLAELLVAHAAATSIRSVY